MSGSPTELRKSKLAHELRGVSVSVHEDTDEASDCLLLLDISIIKNNVI